MVHGETEGERPDSETLEFEFNFRKQMPGEKDILVLDKAIVFDVRCAIHPRMKMTHLSNSVAPPAVSASEDKVDRLIDHLDRAD